MVVARLQRVSHTVPSRLSRARFCSRCQDFKQATKKIDLWSTPKLLCLHLKRFSMEVGSFWVDKLETPIDVPLYDLDLAPYVLSPGEVTNYTLVGVSNHFGGARPRPPPCASTRS